MDQKIKNIYIWGISFLVSEGLKSLLERTGLYQITEIAGSQVQLMEIAGKDNPDLVIVEPTILESEAFDKKKLEKLSFPPAILLLLDSITRNEFQRYSEAGIENIILKNASSREIINAVEAAVNKKKYYSSEILDMILESIESKPQAETVYQLTSSEKEIVRLIAGGLTTKDIASRRNISFHTVNTHRKNIFRKLEVTNASELIMKAIKAGWIDNIEYYI